MPINVTLLMRPVAERAFSIEAVFDTVARYVPADIALTTVTSPHPSRGLLSRLRGVWHARQACRAADVVHMTGDAHYLVYLLPGRKTVLTVHDCEFLERSSGLKRWLLWFFWLRLPAWKAARITCVSEGARVQLLRWLAVDAERVSVVENPLSKPLERDERAFNIVRPRLLMIGAGPHKNVERVAEALAGLPVSLEIIARVDEARLARLRAGGLAVEARHNLSDEELAEAYARADILMFPSLAEGFGLPILEAQAVGRPVITSNRAPMRDVAGEGALLVDPEDAGAIRAAVERVIAEPELRAQLVKTGAANVRRFAPERAAQAYADVWRAVAAEAG
ncbi:glycosyltransferase family 4 protein [Erythrobacter sp. EC-HK427]|uniref:glycosyltransferase family 4 protein n=1 Tax=Erythrobacter sp. EC-HK427 TaxID=2038396 RepID=UPI0012562F41|nr:glycosyltransferase family 1 protein [Erythrobacter sp. EC-HK427]VVT14428.1 Glycosyltransferase involved in cell wall bisynthesis [Erythrobacter sp. EC-HK427]